MDDPKWSGNDLIDEQAHGLAPIYTNRLGESVTAHKYDDARGATKFETKKYNGNIGPKVVGLFVHHELVQARKMKGQVDAIAPKPGFSDDQYDRLALLYFIASLRRGVWLIPVFHAVLDYKIHQDAHDDPQNFDLAGWGSVLDDLAVKLKYP
jgi:hypothetical protein